MIKRATNFSTQNRMVRYRYQSIGALAGDTSTSGPQYQMAHQNRWVLTEIQDSQRNSSGGSTNIVTLQYALGSLENGYPERISAINLAVPPPRPPRPPRKQDLGGFEDLSNHRGW